MVTPSKARKYGEQPRSALELVEEAIHLLRGPALGTLLPYYLGALPFVLGLLFFISDMSRNAYASSHCAPAALGVALLFVWMKSWQNVFAGQLRGSISRAPGLSTGFRGLRGFQGIFIAQATVQSTGFIILPLALLVTLPFGWAFAFYQNFCVLESDPDTGFKGTVTRAMRQARHWPGQNHFLLAILALFGLVVFINTGMGIYLFPYLLKKFLGMDTLFSLSGFSVFNTTFWAVCAGFTYLFVDPIIKTVYALRCFYGDAMASGEDLKVALKAIRTHGKSVALMMMAFLIAGTGVPAEAGIKEGKIPVDGQHAFHPISPEQLDRAIDSVIVRPEYTWRLPREKNRPDPAQTPTFIQEVLAWLNKAIRKVIEFIGSLLKKIFDLLRPDSDISKSATGESRLDWMTTIQGLLLLVLCLSACVLAIYLRRLWLARKPPLTAEGVPDPVPELYLSRDQIDAQELPVDRWVALGETLLAEGALRDALRAFYLATLACLAGEQIITIALFKSNREYQAELSRRRHAQTDLQETFRFLVTVFDRIWYGMHRLEKAEVLDFFDKHRRIVSLVQSS